MGPGTTLRVNSVDVLKETAMARKTTTSSKAASRKTAPARKAPTVRATGAKPKVTKSKRQQPETLRLRSIQPTYTVNDIQRSVAWYRDGLGFLVAERWEDNGVLKGAHLKAGTCQFGLSQDDFSRGREREKGVGFRVWCDTTQSVDAIAARLRAFGGSIVEGPGNKWDSYSFTAQDPDGFKISIMQAR
jgi:catechol 2,3-dioxygenase-like lactoylglutathione lyase family enzyme